MDAFSDEMVQVINGSLSELQQIWDRIGIKNAAKETRASNVLAHVQDLLNEMLAEETALEKKLEEKVRGYIIELTQLAQELKRPQYQLKEDQKVLEQERELHAKLGSWRREKQERYRTQQRLKMDENSLCAAMSETPLCIQYSGIPSEVEFVQIREHISSLTQEKEKRFAIYSKKKKEVADLMLLLERMPETSFEETLVSVDEDSFCLSAHNMHVLNDLLAELLLSKAEVEMMVSNLWERLQVLWDRLEVPSDVQVAFRKANGGLKSGAIQRIQEEIGYYEAQKLAHIEKFVEGVRTELRELWNKCCYSEQQRRHFTHLHDTNYCEELLGQHEAEVAKVSEFYTAHKHMLDQVSRWETLFKQMVECEGRSNDPNRLLSNRGGRLLQEEKERKHVMKQLLKVEQSVKDEVCIWEQQHGHTFMIYDEPFIQHLQKTWNEFGEAKIKAKDDKQKAKTRLMNEEMLYGSKPSTPQRLHSVNTSNRTLRHNKVDETKNTGHSSSLFATPYKRAPVSKTPSKLTNKTAPGTRNRRKSKRLARKALAEYNDYTSDSIFSHTTVSSDASIPDRSGSRQLAAVSPYRNFLAVGRSPMTPTARRPLCHSSLATPPPPSTRSRTNMFKL